MRNQLTLTLTVAACALLIGCSSSNESKKKAEETQAPAAAAPTPETPKASEPTAAPTPPAPEPKKTVSAGLPEKAPDVFKVNLDTSKGPVVMECHKAWAPRGVEHFYDLVKIHFFDDVRFFRVIRGFMAQFGMNGTPATNATWAAANILDDPPTGHHNTRGMVSYGQTGMPNSRSTQLFINFGDNSQLDAQGFPPVCEVTSGMEAVDQFYSGYGEAPNQGLIGAQGNAYLNSQFPRLDYIKKATIVLQ
jgi:peptidyl-prolyl cis-trans isomerase A (cyclophilin A)